MIEVGYYNINNLNNVFIQRHLIELPDFMQQEIIRYKMPNDQQTQLIARLMIKQCIQKKKYNQVFYTFTVLYK